MRFYDNARKAGNFDAGIQQGIMAILASPKFLYRGEQMPADLAAGQSYRISDLDPGIATGVLSVEQRSGRRTAEAGRVRQAA